MPPKRRSVAARGGASGRPRRTGVAYDGTVPEPVSIPASEPAVVPMVLANSPPADIGSVSRVVPAAGVSSAINIEDNDWDSIISDSIRSRISSNKGIDSLEKWSPHDAVKIENWLDKVEILRRVWGWSDTQTCDAVLLKLSEPHCFNDLAAFIKKEEKERGQITWNLVKQYLTRLYKSVIVVSIVRGQLYNCKQDVTADESVINYSIRFRAIAAKLNEMDQSEKVDIYINGLNIELQQEVLTQINQQSMKSLGVVERLAVEAEIFKKKKDQQRQQFSRANNYNINSVNNNKRGRRGGYSFGNSFQRPPYQPNSDKSPSPTLINAASNSNASNASNMPLSSALYHQANAASSRSTDNNNSSIECWHCHKKGHTAAQCWSNPNGGNRGRQPEGIRGGRGVKPVSSQQ
jgi:hypothetical protein